MEGTFAGTVDGIDVQAFGGRSVPCQAIHNNRTSERIQIETYDLRLQSALELASAKQRLSMSDARSTVSPARSLSSVADPRPIRSVRILGRPTPGR